MSTDIFALKDHDYVLKENKVYGVAAFKEKDYVSFSCQTDIDHQQIDDMIKNELMLRADNKTLENELNNMPVLKRKLFRDITNP